MPPSPGPPAPPVDNVAALRQALLDWYDQHARVLPWRAPPGAAPGDPYRVWVSEVMLQQTTVAAVIPYFDRFMQRFPTVHALAEAPLEDVLRLWAGLGYYSRGRNLHAAARVLAASGWPADEAGWRALPGIGDYTAAAVAAIALGQPATVVDGNIERVMARLFAVREPLPSAKPELRGLAARFTAADRPGDFAQALMDLGATVCTPKSPRCGECPVRAGCKGFAAGDPASMPRKAAKPEKTMRHGVAFFLTRQDQLYLVRRPAKGLLGGMPALPSPPWRAKPVSGRSLLVGAPIETDWRAVGAISHVFTHFPLTLQVLVGRTDGSPQAEGWWAPLTGYDHGLPTVFLKAYERGLSALADQP